MGGRLPELLRRSGRAQRRPARAPAHPRHLVRVRLARADREDPALQEKRGWDFPWYSSYGSDFNYDFKVTVDETVAPAEYNYKTKAEHEAAGTGYYFDAEQPIEQPGLSCFLRVGDEVFHTYSTFGRGAESLGGSYYWLDLTALGRQEDWEEPKRPRRQRAGGDPRLRELRIMAPRSIWNGTITFGLVNVPIKLYTATESKTVSFSQVHVSDGAKIEHRRFCPKEDKQVDYKDTVKGYEVSEGSYVVLEKDEVKAAAGDRGKVVHLEEFVDAADIDPVFYEKTYYAGSRDAEDAYRLLHEALRKSGRAGIGRFTFHDREYLVAVRALDDVIALHTLRFHDEVVGPDDLELDLGRAKPRPKEVEMAGAARRLARAGLRPGGTGRTATARRSSS